MSVTGKIRKFKMQQELIQEPGLAAVSRIETA
jgi:hypothetical protein